ncbi:hypothetical protein KPH14_006325 [Odynerus spinipes]|uniref:Uncharacterized protein n=1 Tax=Odynerus spinipes TaxID=1348599 RepID=A0AAD9RZT3_9HYME|nr:hypothetical protein KPH14_006325 [Odynerus spinipes]
MVLGADPAFRFSVFRSSDIRPERKMWLTRCIVLLGFVFLLMVGVNSTASPGRSPAMRYVNKQIIRTPTRCKEGWKMVNGRCRKPLNWIHS